MKKWMSYLFLCFILLSAPAQARERGFKFYFCGIDLDVISEINRENVVDIFLGCIVSVAVHEVGHVLYAHSRGWDVDLRSAHGCLYTSTDHEGTAQEQRRFHRAGFVLQTAVGTCLVNSRLSHSWFTAGYNAFESFQLCTYDLRNTRPGLEGDFYYITQGGGDGERDRGVFITINQLNNITLNQGGKWNEWKKR